MKHIIFILFIIGIIMPSCEYKLEGTHHQDLDPPSDIMPISINLNDVAPMDTIYIYKPTEFVLKINAGGKSIHQVKVLFGDKKWDVYNNPYTFKIDPFDYKEGNYKFSVNVISGSGTGSIADLMGLEGYQGEISWNICIINIYNKKISAGHRINQDGLIEIFWDNGTLPDEVIDRYVIEFVNSNKKTVITKPSQKSIIDYDYIGGRGFYRVTTYLKSITYSYNEFVNVNFPKPNIYFEDVGLDSLKIFWDKAINGYYCLKKDEDCFFSSTIDTSVVTSNTPFGKRQNYELEITPARGTPINDYNHFKISGYRTLGRFIGYSAQSNYVYNMVSNTIYSTYSNNLLLSTIDELNFTRYGNISYGGSYSLSTPLHSFALAVINENGTFIFKEIRYMMMNSIYFPELKISAKNVYLNAYTDNDRLFIMQQNDNNCNVYNLQSLEKIFDFTVNCFSQSENINNATVSADGRYFCSTSENGMELFQINETNAMKLLDDTRNYSAAIFLPNHSNVLLLQLDDQVELRSMPNFELLKNIELKESVLCNIDPITNYILYHQNDSLRIASLEMLSKPFISIKSDDKMTRMYNHVLLSNISVLDLKSYLK